MGGWGARRHGDAERVVSRRTGAWAETHEPVGAEIADRSFLLNSTVYIRGGTGLQLEHFRVIWLWRNEIVSGGTIVTGGDPDVEPRTEGITMVGADPDEGVPFKTPDPEPREHGIPRHCLTS